MSEQILGPKAPKDPTAKRPYFYIMQSQEVYGAPQPDGRGIQFIYEDGRFADCARRVGHVTDEDMLKALPTVAGFRRIVHSIGVSVSEQGLAPVTFAMQMYPTHAGEASTTITKRLIANGDEQIIELDGITWTDTDDIIGQIRFEFDVPGLLAVVDVRLYLNDGYTAPEQTADINIDWESDNYAEMIRNSLLSVGDTSAMRHLLALARAGEDVTLAFIGGSITQGAGAVPIHEKSYARQFADSFADEFSAPERVRLIKAGVGGTPSELGMIRFRRDILRNDTERPDLIVIEFAVNDAGDETGGACFESLVRKALTLEWHPAVVLLFAVFSDDYNLQDRLIPIGEHYKLPMVSVKNAVSPQFNLSPSAGRVMSKNQYFYDQFHPSNNGHRVMSDCLMNLFEAVEQDVTLLDNDVAKDAPNAAAADAGCNRDAKSVRQLLEAAPVMSGRFENIELLDKKDDPLNIKAQIECGSFKGTDREIQYVEMDSEIEPVAEFPYNWHYDGSEDAPAPFVMRCVCRRVVAVFKDSGDAAFGRADCFVDGEKAVCYDPLDIGWNHCGLIIICDGDESLEHTVEIRMAAGDEHKKFTILGFGVVE